ncbi:MAG: hypothetical protein KTR21_12920 [Rhodobacteraceae bacterium]|nr:hypothetical protein [Paracoccaceae bacterium]
MFFAAVFEAPIQVRHDKSDRAQPAAELYALKVLDVDVGRQLLEGFDRRFTPFSEYLLGALGNLMDDSLRLNIGEQLFDDLEYLWCLMSVDAEFQREADSLWTPYGSFIWRRKFALEGREGTGLIGDARQAQKDWPALRDGLFGGQKARLDKAVEAATPLLVEISRKMR